MAIHVRHVRWLVVVVVGVAEVCTQSPSPSPHMEITLSCLYRCDPPTTSTLLICIYKFTLYNTHTHIHTRAMQHPHANCQLSPPHRCQHDPFSSSPPHICICLCATSVSARVFVFVFPAVMFNSGTTCANIFHILGDSQSTVFLGNADEFLV